MEGGGLGFSSGSAGTSNSGPIRVSYQDDTRVHRTHPYSFQDDRRVHRAHPYAPYPVRRHPPKDASRRLRDIVEAASLKASSSVASLLRPILARTKDTVARVLAGTSPKMPVTEGLPAQHLHNTGYSDRSPREPSLLTSPPEQSSSPGATGADGNATGAVRRTTEPQQLPNSDACHPTGQGLTELSNSSAEESGHAFVVPAPRRVAGAGALRAAFPSALGKSRTAGHPVFRSIDGHHEAKPFGGASQHTSARHSDTHTLQQRSVRPMELSSMRDDIIGPLDAVLDAYLGGMRCQVDELERGARKRRKVLEESIQAKLAQQPPPIPRRLLAARFPAIAPGAAPKLAMDAWPSRTESGDGLERRDAVGATSSAAAQQAVSDRVVSQRSFLGKEGEENQRHAKETTSSTCNTEANDSTKTVMLSLPQRKDLAAAHQQEDAGSAVATAVRDSANPVSGVSAVAPGMPIDEKPQGAAEDVVKVETREDFWRVQIEAIYRRRNPHKLAEVPQLLAKHLGHEASLYCKICRRYDLNPKLLYADPKAWEAEDKDVKDDDDADCPASSPPAEVNTAIPTPFGGPGNTGVSLFGRADITPGGTSGGSSLFGGTCLDTGSTQSPGLSGGLLFGTDSGAAQAKEDRATVFPASSTASVSLFGAAPSMASSETSTFGVAPPASSAISSSTMPGSASSEAKNAVASIFGTGSSMFNFGSSSSGGSSIFKDESREKDNTVGAGSDGARSIFTSAVTPGDGTGTNDGDGPPPSISSIFGSPPPEKHGLSSIFGPPPKAGGIFDNQPKAAAPLFGVPLTPSVPVATQAVENVEDQDDNEHLQQRRKADKEVMAKRRIVRAKRSRPAAVEAVPPHTPQPAFELAGTAPFAGKEDSAKAVVAPADGGSSAARGSPFAGMAAAGKDDSGAKQLQTTPSSTEEKPSGTTEEKPGEQTSEGEKPISVESKYDFWKVQIEAIYRRRNPHKMSDVPKLLEKYKDSEVTLYRKVCLRYDLDSNKLYADPKAWEGEEKDVKDDDDDATGTAEGGTSGSTAVLPGPGMASIFGSHASGGSIFGGPSTGGSSGSLFGTGGSSGSLFGGPSTGGSTVSRFGGPSIGSSSLFSTPTQSTSSGNSSSSLFGGASSGVSLFGGAGAAGSNSGSIFGTGGTIFGATSSSNSIFGTGATKPSGLGIFGGASQGQSSGETSAIGTTSSAGLFGSSNSGGLFGGGSSFSFGATPSSGISASTGSGLFVFGAGTTAAATSASSASFGVGGFSAAANSTPPSGRSGIFGAAFGESRELGKTSAGLAGSAGSSLFGSAGMADEGASKRKRRLA